MMLTENQEKAIIRELHYVTSRSGGKGGQNVNKVETKVELIFDIPQSTALDEEQKTLILKKLEQRDRSGILRITASASRSQLQNKEEAREKLFRLLEKLLKVQTKRKPTKKSRSSREKNLHYKKKHSEKKELRRKNW